MSLMVAPSRSTCFTLEFMKTVHRVPKSHGVFDSVAFNAKSEVLCPKLLAKVSMKDPHPDEQASLISIRSMMPLLTKIAFMS